ncbi:uncharacterized protein EI97DRAFT_240116 [Westerdykella ornata]|uniref:Uncharacterized protein n=1 Tax=Westerdykella ornata TaxID=318751 RepID=A0A6A6J6Z2_WESOR|nr:uncharacterized protein EI97DRAFT_240116 [Westerdykella ornata]KAF2271923.1 hypothetical protein EI97DRAFT_240116 [Westerdykella ornata]
MAVLSSSPSAVYSEPVKTNLDRLPPSSYRTNLKGAPKNTQNSRKSSTMRGGTRGRRGRPRGGLSRADAMVDRNTQQESAKDVASDMSEPSAPEPSRTDMAAPRRKSTRARGEGPASRLSTTEDNSLPSKPNGDGTRKRNVRDLNGSPGESASNGASKVPGGQNEPRKRIKLSQQKPAKKGPKTKSNGIRTENGESNALKSINEASTPTRVEYFARVQNSSNASVEIPIPATFLAVDATLVERYIEYKAEEEEGLNLSLEQFVKISEFANRK